MNFSKMSCHCKLPKKHQMTIDCGKAFGNCIVDLCDGCYAQQNMKFVISEKDI